MNEVEKEINEIDMCWLILLILSLLVSVACIVVETVLAYISVFASGFVLASWYWYRKFIEIWG